MESREHRQETRADSSLAMGFKATGRTYSASSRCLRKAGLWREGNSRERENPPANSRY